MDSKVPFISEYEATRPLPLKQYRPISVRPWTLSLYLAATGICFGLLLAVSLVEKEPTTSSITKRNEVYTSERSALLAKRTDMSTTTEAVVTPVTTEEPACTSTVTAVVILCITQSGYTCTERTSAPAPDPTGTCSSVTVSEISYDTGDLISLVYPASTTTAAASTTPAEPTAAASTTEQICYATAYETITSCVAESGYTCAEQTPTPTAAATTGSCLTVTATTIVYDTGNLISLVFPASSSSAAASTSTDEQCYVTATAIVTSCVAKSGYTCAEQAPSTTLAAATTGECSTVTVSSIVYDTGNLISLVFPSSTSSPTSSTQNPTTPDPPPSEPTTTPEYSPESAQTTEPVVVQPQNPTSKPSDASPSSDQGSASGTTTPTPEPVGTPSLTSQSSTLLDTSNVLSLTSQSSTLLDTSNVLSLVSPSTDQMTQSPAGMISLTSEVYTTTIMVIVTSTVEEATLETLSQTSQALTPLARPSAMSQTTVLSSFETYVVVISAGTTRSEPYTGLLTDGSSLTTTENTKSSSVTSSSSSSTTSLWQDPVPNEDLVLIKAKFEIWYYFVAVYLPKIIAVIMATLWSIIFAGLKFMEPFYQLSANKGAYASDTMFGNYLASEINLLSLSATFQGQWVLLLGGAVLIGWAAIVALSSESMMIISTDTCTLPGVPEFRCAPAWAVSRSIIYVLLGLIGFVFILTLILILILSRRKRSGVFIDPSSIASMAELLGNPLVMEDLQAIKPSSSDREVRLFLGENRYKLGLYDSSSGKETFFGSTQAGEPRWGLIKIDQIPSAQTLAGRRQTDYGAVLNPTIMSVEEGRANHRRRIFQNVFDSLMLLTALCILALIWAYLLDHGNDPFNNFFNRGAFGPRFVLTSLALILSVGWRRTSQEMTVMAPYRSMARAFQKQSSVMAARSILAPTARTCWTALYKSVPLGRFLITLVALCAVMADVLLIAVSGVPFSSGQTLISYQVATFTSTGILGIMVLTSVAVIIYNRTPAGGTRKLPRSPDTLLGVWLYLCHSKLVIRRGGSSDEQESSLDDESLKMKYDRFHCGFARVIGEDGVRRWTVDAVSALGHASPGNIQSGYRYDKYAPPDRLRVSQRPESYEASATPVESPYQRRQPQDGILRSRPVAGFQPVHQQAPLYQNGIPFFEAQAKSPTLQAPEPRFEEMRPPRHNLQGQNVHETRRSQPREQPEPSIHEALAQWEYEQEFFNMRRQSGASSEYSRWTNDGKSRYRYS